MTATVTPSETSGLDRRQRRVLVAAWAATMLPLVAFGYLVWQSVKVHQETSRVRHELQQKLSELEDLERVKRETQKQIDALQGDLKAQRESTKHYRDVAGVQIQFYRESDREVVKKALVTLGFAVDSRLGQSRLVDRQPNTIAYGSLVSHEDLREIAVALVNAGFPLKRITRAVRQPDPRLIQVYASFESDRQCGVMSASQVRAGETCGPRLTP